MNSFRLKSARAVLSLVLLISASTLSWAQPMPIKAKGHGGFPLTSAVASMWGVIDEGVLQCPQPLTFMIYFRGRAGWHNRKSTSEARLDEDPAVIQFDVGGIMLRAKYKKDTRTLLIFDKSINTERANVVLVDKVDQPGEEEVTELGRADLCIPDGAIPAVYVLEGSELIRSVVLGKGQ